MPSATDSATCVVRASVDDHAAVLVSVTDSGTEQPQLLPPDPRRIGGVGLRIVDEVAASWGVLAIPWRQDGMGDHRPTRLKGV